jgi:hypothetical protein
VTQQPQDAANALLMGGGTKSIKWADHSIGHTVIGTIVDQPKVEQMKKYQSTELDFWKSGDPKMQIVVTIQTDERDPSDADDDGKRRLYIEPRMMQSVREAVQCAGAKGLAIGGRIALRWIAGSGVGEGNARQFAAEYAPPAVDPGSLLGGNGATPATTQAAPPAQAQPAQAAAPAVSPVAQSLGLTGPATPPPAPPGVDPAVWAGLPDTQKAAVLAAMAVPSF